MFSFNSLLITLTIIVAGTTMMSTIGVVDAQHVRSNKHYHLKRLPGHRTQCRPRLSSASSSRACGDHRQNAAHNNGTVPHANMNHPIGGGVVHVTPTSVHAATTPTAKTKDNNNHQSLSKKQPFTNAASYIPNSNKAGIAGGDAYPYFKDHIGWWYDWSPNPSKPGSPLAVPMLWGGGTADSQDAQRLHAFSQILQSGSNRPPYILGFEEPDCASGDGSAGMSVSEGVEKWEELMAPMRARGAKLGSPSMCKQADETWLGEFRSQIKTDWDFTAIHVNKNNLEGVKKDIDHYMKYGKPIWVTEFACVNDVNGFIPCTDQSEINAFINEIVHYLEDHPNVFAYAYSNGLGLGDVWPLMEGGSLSESGRTYLNAIKKYH